MVRKTFAVLIMIFLAIPILIGMTWAVGAIRLVLSPDVLSDLPRDIITHIPEIVDSTFAAAQNNDYDMDRNSRAWLSAMAKVPTKPSVIVEKSGMLKWSETELTTTLAAVGDMLRGNRPMQTIALNMVPLKAALTNDAFKNYLAEIAQNLPACSDAQNKEWQWARAGNFSTSDLPPCRPNPAVFEQFFERGRNKIMSDIPNQVYIFKDVDNDIPPGFFFIKGIVSFSYFLFIIPAFFILLGALLAARSRSEFFKWAGVTILIGGGIALGLTMGLNRVVTEGIQFSHFHRHSHAEFAPFFDKSLDKNMASVATMITNRISKPVERVAESVCIIGLILAALGFAFPDERRHAPPVAPPVQQQSTPPASPPQ